MMTTIKPPYRVIVVDADERRRLQHATKLSRDDDFLVVGTFSGRRECVNFIERNGVDFAVVNTVLSEGNSAELIRQILRCHPAAQILTMSDADDEINIMQTITAGANGYVLLSDGHPDPASCLRLMLSGGSPVSPSIARTVLRTLQCRAQMRRQAPADSPLSSRELDIVRLLSQGISFQDTAEILAISSHTVSTHIKKIYRKLDVHSRNQAVVKAQQLGLLD